jgi:hypothetical protein
LGNVLVDGFYAGHWKISHKRDTTTLRVSVRKITKSERSELEAEAGRLLTFVAPQAQASEIRLTFLD